MPPRVELAASDIFNEKVLDELPLGVVVLDREGYVVKYNSFEERLARRSRHDVIGRSFFQDVAVCTDTDQVRGRFEAHIADNSLAEDIEYSFALPFLPKPRDVRLLLRSFDLEDNVYGILLIEDITEEKELEREKEALLSVLMHDLNNPLQGILGYASLLHNGVLGEVASEQQLDALRAITESSTKMKQLIEGTLSDLRGDARRRQAVNLHALVLSSIGNLLPEARDKGVDLQYLGQVHQRTEFPRRAVRVRGLVDHLASLVQNLLSNAVKYAESTVEVKLESRDGAAYLEVQDDGRGIPKADQGRIFDKGFQSAGSLPGHGLGLFSIRRVLDEHGGTIEVESEPGEGALFRVVIPVD